MIQHFKNKNKKNKNNTNYHPILNQYYKKLLFLLNSKPNNQNTKKLKHLKNITKIIKTSTLKHLINKNKTTYQNINNYHNIIKLTKTHHTTSFIKKFTNFFKIL